MHNEWREIQKLIWNCSVCEGDPKVEWNIRQQTEAPLTMPRLLVIAVAPPYSSGIPQKTIAKSVTNSVDDRLRKFLEGVFQRQWQDLLSSGAFVLHAVKCAIPRTERGNQNPHSSVVDACASRHLAREFDILRPPIVLCLGIAARRAVFKMPGFRKLKGGKLSGPPEGDHDVSFNGHFFRLIVTRFPRGEGKQQAASDLQKAAKLSGITEEE
jgi:hypothetical protein